MIRGLTCAAAGAGERQTLIWLHRFATMKAYSQEPLIHELWQEHLAAPFPKRLRGKDLSGVDFVMLDASIAGCVTTFLERGALI